MSRTPLPQEIQAAINANVAGDAMRGLVLIVSAVTASLNPAYLPSPAHHLVAALCEDLTCWVVIAGPTSPYCHVRPPVSDDGVSGCVVDLRHVHRNTPCSEGFPPEVWAKVREAARRYRAAQVPSMGASRLAAMRTEGHA